MKFIPNLITSLRIIGAIGLIFTEQLSPLFFVIYTLAGLSDALDGWIARSTHTTSKAGAVLDSIADLLFYAVMVLKIFPTLWEVLPRVIWFGVLFVLLLRLVSYLVAGIKFRKFAALHTYMNKVTGMLVFLIPYMILLPVGTAYCWFSCGVGILASVEELLIHILRKEYSGEVKTIGMIRKV